MATQLRDGIEPRPVRDPDAVRWAIGGLLALPVVVAVYSAILFIALSFAADAWSGLRNSLGY